MLDIRYIVNNLKEVQNALATRGGEYPLGKIVSLDKKRRDILQEVEQLKAKRNTVSEEVAKLKREKKDASAIIAQMQEVNVRIKTLDDGLSEVEKDIKDIVLGIPNIPHSSVVIGKSDEDNKVEREHLKPAKFKFTPLPHWELGEQLGILDIERAAKITGSRFVVTRKMGATLERALINFMLDTHLKHGYEEIFPPFLINRESMTGTGQLPKFEEDAFAVKDTNYFLAPTAEVPVTNLLRNEVIPEDKLPINYTAYTACFRAEAGAAGRDTRGLIRVHQFNKVELVKFAAPEKSMEELEKLTADAERILKLLELPYRVSQLCTGDMGFSSCKTYDIEVWMPSYERYVEISSCSCFSDFQSRRINIKYKTKEGKSAFVHTLNGSGIAVGRCLAAIIENYQNEDGSITVPKVLVPYVGTNIIK
ncbi:MAG: serine--tRNA ligase [Firmicutes bacterium]|nr:serine--tRNA ligase [Bacillota bacterium]